MNLTEKKTEEMEKVKKEILDCKKCPLFKTRRNAVPGEGSLNAQILFCGEAPGLNEDQEGRPFCGSSGKILDELLESAGIKRESVYIANVVKCRPITPDLENRAPSQEEIMVCSFYLERQIEIIKPEVICTLGNYSTAFILEKYGLKDKIDMMTKIHGKIFLAFIEGYGGSAEARYSTSEDGKVKTIFNAIKIIPLYHPAVATYNPGMKQVLFNDFQILKQIK